MSEPFPDSVEESSLRRTVLRDQGRLGGGSFTLQMRQDPLDNCWLFNAGNDLDLPSTALAGLAGLNIDVKYTLEPLHPGHRSVAIGRHLVQPVVPSGLMPLAPPAPLTDSYLPALLSLLKEGQKDYTGRRDTHTKLAIGREHPMKTSKICTWLGH
jgi:hypothetical protein